MEPKFKKGQSVINIQTGKEVLIKSLNTKRYTVRKDNRVTGTEDVFTGSYYCSWFDDKGKLISGDIEEGLLSKPS